MTGGEERVPWVYTCAMNTIADLRQKLQDERDGAEEALKVKDEEIAALRLAVANQDNRIAELLLRCSNLESEVERWQMRYDEEADAYDGLLTAYEIAGLQ